jgi:hypothetical protein
MQNWLIGHLRLYVIPPLGVLWTAKAALSGAQGAGIHSSFTNFDFRIVILHFSF